MLYAPSYTKFENLYIYPFLPKLLFVNGFFDSYGYFDSNIVDTNSYLFNCYPHYIRYNPTLGSDTPSTFLNSGLSYTNISGSVFIIDKLFAN
jgi:hypothetical protein